MFRSFENERVNGVYECIFKNFSEKKRVKKVI
jgi:hypothetical protein